jgi:hypothetical protein
MDLRRSPEFALKDSAPDSEKKFGGKFGESSEKTSEKILAILRIRSTGGRNGRLRVSVLNLGICNRAIRPGKQGYEIC